MWRVAGRQQPVLIGLSLLVPRWRPRRSKFALGLRALVEGKDVILFLGGWLVLEGRSDVGTVVGRPDRRHTRTEGPWRDLVSFFRSASTVRVKYAMLEVRDRVATCRRLGGPLCLAASTEGVARL